MTTENKWSAMVCAELMVCNLLFAAAAHASNGGRMQHRAVPNDTVTWTCGSLSHDRLWSNLDNWDHGPPTDTSDVIIRDATSTCPSLVDVNSGVHNLTINPGGLVEVPDNTTLEIHGDNVVVNGQLFLNNTGGGITVLDISGRTATLSGTGYVTMSNSNDNIIRAAEGSTFSNQLESIQGIQGAGIIGSRGSLQNYGIINANVNIGRWSLSIAPSGGLANFGTLEATSGGTLFLLGGEIMNWKGSIYAAGGEVLLEEHARISGGTMSTSGGGTIGPSPFGSGELDTVTLDNPCQYLILGGTETSLRGRITNNGTIKLEGVQDRPARLNIQTAVAIGGSGSITVLGPVDQIVGDGSLLNQHLIQGTGGIINLPSLDNQGTIRALSSNFSVTLQIGNWTNTGLIQATPGASVSIFGGTLANDGGSIAANGGTVIFDYTPLVMGGTVATSSGGVARLKSGTFDGSNNPFTIAGFAQLLSDDDFTLKAIIDFDHDAELSIANTGGGSRSTLNIAGAVTFNPSGRAAQGGATGRITMSSSPNNIIQGVTGTEILTNNITIQGAGNIGNDLMSLVNGTTGQINANSSSVPLLISMGPQNVFANNGSLSVAANIGSAASVLAITGPFANFDATTRTLTGGNFNILGTLRIDNADIVNNQATLALAGQIVNQNGENGLANFANNTGAFTLLPQTFTPTFTSAGPFTNSGTFKVSRGSTFLVGGSGTSYIQTGGATTVDGTLRVPTGGVIDITAGTLAGTGTLFGDVSVGTTPGGDATDFIIGDSFTEAGRISVANNYLQLPTCILDVQIGGTMVGTEYSQLNVTGAATLSGSLNITRINDFTPALGQTFTILNASAGITGTFFTVIGLSIDEDEHFELSYTPTGVVLTVTPGP